MKKPRQKRGKFSLSQVELSLVIQNMNHIKNNHLNFTKNSCTPREKKSIKCEKLSAMSIPRKQCVFGLCKKSNLMIQK